MTQAASSVEKPQGRALKTPLDRLIIAVANRIGGSKAKEVERFLKFAVVGTIGAVVDLGIFNLLTLTILAGPEGGLNFYVAATFSFICAVISNFTWNRFWTYPDSRSRPILRQLAQFALVSVIGWSVRTLWLRFSVDFVVETTENVVVQLGSPIDPQWAGQLGANFTLLLAIFVVMIWNFFVNRYWTYNDVD